MLGQSALPAKDDGEEGDQGDDGAHDSRHQQPLSLAHEPSPTRQVGEEGRDCGDCELYHLLAAELHVALPSYRRWGVRSKMQDWARLLTS